MGIKCRNNSIQFLFFYLVTQHLTKCCGYLRNIVNFNVGCFVQCFHIIICKLTITYFIFTSSVSEPSCTCPQFNNSLDILASSVKEGLHVDFITIAQNGFDNFFCGGFNAMPRKQLLHFFQRFLLPANIKCVTQNGIPLRL